MVFSLQSGNESNSKKQLGVRVGQLEKRVPLSNKEQLGHENETAYVKLRYLYLYRGISLNP